MKALLRVFGVFVFLLFLHFPVLRLPYFWDETGYFIPAALDFYRQGLLIPKSTAPSGHTPLVPMYLGTMWRIFGFSPQVTRTAMILVAAVALAVLYELGRQAADREIAAWSVSLLAVSPLFFAQSSLAHLDVAAGLFTTLAVMALLRERLAMFALAASLAILSKETAAILAPVAWGFAWPRLRARRAFPLRNWIWLLAPLVALLTWTLYYHQVTGYWTGNRDYLEYNLYSTLSPVRVLVTLPRRLYQVFIAGFNWLLVVGATLGIWWQPKRRDHSASSPSLAPPNAIRHSSQSNPILFPDLLLFAGLLCAAYVIALSIVGGAVLRRYLLPVFPVAFLVSVVFVFRLPRIVARGFCCALVACFVAAWRINPPRPFPYEDNLAYADFIWLHQQAAQFLETQAATSRILTAWPASDELRKPFLGYVQQPLRTVPLSSFTSKDFEGVLPESFDILYLFSQKWKWQDNWLARSRHFAALRERYFNLTPPIPEAVLLRRYRLTLVKSYERRGQWVRIYSRPIPEKKHSAQYSIYPMSGGS